VLQFPQGPFPAIVADPPWSFNDRGTRLNPSYKGKQRKDREAKHYETLPLREICELPVDELAAEDAYLFLWIPAALRETWCYELVEEAGTRYTQSLRDAKAHDEAYAIKGFHTAVMEAWGFETTHAEIIWVKGRVDGADLRLQIGGGHTVRNAHEVCVIGRRGKPERLDRGVPSVILEPRGKHSAKPDIFYETVRRLCPGPYIDIYGRKQHEGFVVWGDQAEEDTCAKT